MVGISELITRISPCVILTVNVDDVGIEAVGAARRVQGEMLQVVRAFTDKLMRIGMESSKTNNVCNASSSELANHLVKAMVDLNVRRRDQAISLGSLLLVRQSAVMRRWHEGGLRLLGQEKPCFAK